MNNIKLNIGEKRIEKFEKEVENFEDIIKSGYSTISILFNNDIDEEENINNNNNNNENNNINNDLINKNLKNDKEKLINNNNNNLFLIEFKKKFLKIKNPLFSINLIFTLIENFNFSNNNEKNEKEYLKITLKDNTLNILNNISKRIIENRYIFSRDFLLFLLLLSQLNIKVIFFIKYF
jgi:hypothetical protein